ncbi:transglycosylase domain-containing protein [Bifidobacterium animalis]|uniref:transglycosylase domain-containing protein n=1 Tax=Bifidobacterium animalis TaxID=28025 RepID=UPI00069BC389|nr:transglycosylase domain-containing protein [Bifidobacterium animalis]KOA44891.1 carboxypeptidase [Bifidobacterium animalis subsp. lactis ATCC 27673]RYN07328.1 transglycosylase [Bifidobacterium animalis subsp. lactis]
MPKKKKKNLTGARILALALAFITLCLGGGVTLAVLFLPTVMGANQVVKAVTPSMQVEGIDFDVTNLPQKSTMYASDGKTVIAEFYAQNREVVPLKDISKPMMQAVVAREDRRFWEHAGVDVQGVLRAFVQTYMKKGDQQGGSSLTQQYVKNVLATQAREKDDPIAEYHATEDTIARKMREMLISVQMEKKYSKQEILQGYLNIAQFGTNSLYGVQAAAERYFNTTADKLNIVQAATIAMITKNPSKYDPSIPENQEEAQKQRNIVLELMKNQHFITQAEYEEAVKTPLVDTLHITPVSRGCMAAKYNTGFFCDYVVHKIENSPEFGKTAKDRERLLQEGGLQIVTTLDLDASNALMDVANKTIPANDSSGMEIVMASVKPGTGEVLGFGLNRAYDATDAAATDQTKSSMNYAVDQIDGGGQGFPIGSSWKPINLVAWMQQGRSVNEMLVAPTDFLTNRFTCNGYTGGTDNWHVTNALTNGTVSPESPFLGLVHSHNTTMAAMGAQIGLCAVADAAKAVGYHNAKIGQEDVYSDISMHPALLIGGTTSVSPLTMANVYATYAANGVECTPIALKKVTNSDGKDLDVPKANCHQAVDKDIIQTLAYTMNQGVTRPDGAAGAAQLANGRKTFAKTGTNENMYVTTGGFIPNQIATFVLVGDVQDPTNHPIENIAINGNYHGYWDGSTIAAPAFKDAMNQYADKKQLPMDNDYGQPVDKYTKSVGVQSNRQGTQQNTQRR